MPRRTKCYSSIVLSYDLDNENWTVIGGSYHRMPEVKFSHPTLLLPVEVWPQRKSGYQGYLHNFAVVLQRTFVYSRAASSNMDKMPPKRNKSKVSFKIFSTENYSKFANRFPFLEERQIKAKLLQAWRNRFTTETKKAQITKLQNEAQFNEGKTDLVFFTKWQTTDGVVLVPYWY